MPPYPTGYDQDDRQPPNPDFRLEGVVERLTFHSPDTGFCVLRVKVRGYREPVTVVGTAPAVHPGEMVDCQGSWVVDRDYGRQFRASTLRITPPGTPDGIARYLGSGLVHGFGPRLAKRLVEGFGLEVFEVIEHTPERLLDLPGIGPGRQRKLVEAWESHKAVRRVMVFLQSYGFGTARALRIHKTYGDEAVERIREDPYRLALDISGIGFKSADALAQRLGVGTDSPLRARAGVRHWLQEHAAQGHCAATEESLVRAAAALLGTAEDTVLAAVRDEVASGGAAEEAIDGQLYIALPALFHAERGVANHLLRLMHGQPPWGLVDVGRALSWVRDRVGIQLSQSQQGALAMALRSKVSVVTGGPGVGKTTLLNSLLRIVSGRSNRIQLATPTGRAAKRLAESTGLEARTLHRLLEVDPGRGTFKRGRDRPLEADLVVVDECSMVDVVLMNALLRAIPDRAGLVLVGDVDQLPSIGPGAVLADIIASDAVPVARLTEVFRQAAQSRIVANAHRVNSGLAPLRGERPEDDFHIVFRETPEAIASTVCELVCRRIPKRLGLDPIGDVQVLTPMLRGAVGARALNRMLQAELNGAAQPRVSRFGYEFAPGDKVVQTVNDYDREVFNGDLGRIAQIDEEEGVARIAVEGRMVEYGFGELDEVQPAYALSIHKAQGSEYPAVVIPLSTSHYPMLARNLLYTGITRGKHLVVLVAQPKALAIAVRNARSAQRITHLARRLRAAGEGPEAR
jgi:exodeoxyribonuclease V alpha subunit